MFREVALWVLGMLGVVLVGLACGGPNPNAEPGTAAAQATATRRAAVNQVQRMIANHPTSTPPPEPTATPIPTCQNAIWWTDARAHVGESRTVQGMVVATRPAPGGAVMLELGQPYPDPTGLSVIVPSGGAPPGNGAMVCVAGSIALSEGRILMLPTSASSIQTVQSAR